MATALSAAALLLAAEAGRGAEAVRVKDLGRLRGWRENALVGYGIVTGLAGSGDSPTSRTTRQALSNVLSRFGLTVPPEQVQSRNVAVVMVSATLPPFARPGDTLDVTVASAGDARSLLGGTLLVTPLEAPNGKVYALARGPLSVGGYRYDANGNIVQKNHPTVGAIPNGATVEQGVQADVVGVGEKLTFVLTDPDFTTADRIASAINAEPGLGEARAVDASGIEIQVGSGDRTDLVQLVARLENITVEPDRRARVVVNERSGTVVAGGDVRLSAVAISHGDLKVTITEWSSASQPEQVAFTGPGVRTAIVRNTEVQATEPPSAVYVGPSGNTVADLVHALSVLKVSSRDVIAILQAIKAAGALRAELVIQ